jgi:hypothetical protein
MHLLASPQRLPATRGFSAVIRTISAAPAENSEQPHDGGDTIRCGKLTVMPVGFGNAAALEWQMSRCDHGATRSPEKHFAENIEPVSGDGT